MSQRLPGFKALAPLGKAGGQMPMITHRPCSGRTSWALRLLVVVLKAKRACLPGCLLKLTESVPRRGVRAGLSPRTGPLPGDGLRGATAANIPALAVLLPGECAGIPGKPCPCIPASLPVLLGVGSLGDGQHPHHSWVRSCCSEPHPLGSCASSPSPKSYFYTVL